MISVRTSFVVKLYLTTYRNEVNLINKSKLLSWLHHDHCKCRWAKAIKRCHPHNKYRLSINMKEDGRRRHIDLTHIHLSSTLKPNRWIWINRVLYDFSDRKRCKNRKSLLRIQSHVLFDNRHCFWFMAGFITKRAAGEQKLSVIYPPLPIRKRLGSIWLI